MWEVGSEPGTSSACIVIRNVGDDLTAVVCVTQICQHAVDFVIDITKRCSTGIVHAYTRHPSSSGVSLSFVHTSASSCLMMLAM